MLPASREVFFRGVGRFVFGVAFRIIRHWGLSIWSVGQRMTDKGMQRVCFVADHQQVRVSGLHARSRYSPAARPARKWPGEDQASGMPNGHPLDNFPTRPKIKRRSPDCFEFIISCPPGPGRPAPFPAPPRPFGPVGRNPPRKEPAQQRLAPRQRPDKADGRAGDTARHRKIPRSGHSEMAPAGFPALPLALGANGDDATTARASLRPPSRARTTPRRSQA